MFFNDCCERRERGCFREEFDCCRREGREGFDFDRDFDCGCRRERRCGFCNIFRGCGRRRRGCDRGCHRRCCDRDFF